VAAKTRYVVACQRHGSESKDWSGKQVVVPRPKSKTERNTLGCPFCLSERQKEGGQSQ
jgi:RNA polymerase subunit RPABC4/transcription elongation factor Spt4